MDFVQQLFLDRFAGYTSGAVGRFGQYKAAVSFHLRNWIAEIGQGCRIGFMNPR
jgi:hypothetical protein